MRGMHEKIGEPITVYIILRRWFSPNMLFLLKCQTILCLNKRRKIFPAASPNRYSAIIASVGIVESCLRNICCESVAHTRSVWNYSVNHCIICTRTRCACIIGVQIPTRNSLTKGVHDHGPSPDRDRLYASPNQVQTIESAQWLYYISWGTGTKFRDRSFGKFTIITCRDESLLIGQTVLNGASFYPHRPDWTMYLANT